MLNDEIKKIKKKYQPILTFQIHDSCLGRKHIIYEKTLKSNPQPIK